MERKILVLKTSADDRDNPNGIPESEFLVRLVIQRIMIYESANSQVGCDFDFIQNPFEKNERTLAKILDLLSN